MTCSVVRKHMGQLHCIQLCSMYEANESYQISATYTIHTLHLTLSGDLPLCVWIMLIELAERLSLSTVKFRFVSSFFIMSVLKF